MFSDYIDGRPQLIFGMPTLIELDDLEATMALSRSLKLNFIEINMNLPQYQVENLTNLKFMKRLKDKYQMFYTIHLDEKMDVCDFNPLVANAYIETVKRTLELSNQLEIPILNMHMNKGVHFTLPHKKVKVYEKYKERYLASILRYRDICEKAIGNGAIKICIENIDGFLDYEKEAVELLLESDVFGLTWDIGHTNACDNTDESFIIKNENSLRHFHIHDGRDKLDHLILGSGEIDLHQRLNLARVHNATCLVEVKTIEALRESVKWLEDNRYL